MGLYSKMLLLYLCISIGFSLWQPTVVFEEASPLKMFNIEYNSSLGDMQFSNSSSIWSDQTGTVNDQLQQEGRNTDKDANPVQSFLYVIDPVWQIIRYVSLFISFLAAPVSFMLFPAFVGVPFVLIMMFCLPVTIMGLVSMVMLLRGVS